MILLSLSLRLLDGGGQRIEGLLGLDHGRLDLATPLVDGVDVGAQGGRLPLEVLQAMKLLEAWVHRGIRTLLVNCLRQWTGDD